MITTTETVTYAPTGWRRIGRTRGASVWTEGVMKVFFDAIERADIPDTELSRKAGVARGLLGSWRIGFREPYALLAAEDILNAAGYGLVVRRKTAATTTQAWVREPPACLSKGFLLGLIQRNPSVWTGGVMCQFFAALDDSGMTYAELTTKAGVARGLIGGWRSGKRNPRAVLNAEAILDAAGYELVVRRKRGRGE